MSLTQEQLFKNVFNLHSVSSENKLLLKNTVNNYPYFGLAHFYALKNSAFHDVHYNRLAAKTKLFFNSPFYLEKIINVDEQESLPNIVNNSLQSNIANTLIKPTIEHTALAINSNIDIEETKPEEETETILPPLPIFSKQEMAVKNDEELLFEPLYTSDYFASQGIKLSDVILSNDKLGNQLKSFTSWLKTMKKTHPEKQFNSNEIAEALIQKQAETSNVETEVFTEPMAEAFAIQGKNIRAIEVYSKLSLMFPEKSAYFAHKIENLK